MGITKKQLNKLKQKLKVYLYKFQPCRFHRQLLTSTKIAQLVKNLPAMKETRFNSLVRKICWRRDRLLTPVFLGFASGLAVKESACNVEDLGLIPGLGRSSGKGKGYPFQYSGLENSMDCIFHGVPKSWTRLRVSLSLSCKEDKITTNIFKLWKYIHRYVCIQENQNTIPV